MFEMSVEDIFTISGLGTVFTGKVLAGPIKPGDQAICKTLSKEIKIRIGQILDSSSRPIQSAESGATVGVVCQQMDLSVFSDSMKSEGDRNRVVGISIVPAPKKKGWFS